MSASEPFQPTGRNPWDKTLAAHLLNRAGFGGLPQDIAQAHARGLQRTVDYLIDFEKMPEAAGPPEMPAWPEGGLRALQELPEQQRRARRRQWMRANREAIEQIRLWWIRRMIRTRRPLQEKLTLFWHGHFATSAHDVKNARHMLRQHEFLRKNCLGNFRDLLLGISRDPAMLKYLDNDSNRKQRPNENYARELLELFTMGIGNYTEADVKEAARAFTGWTFRGEEFVFIERQHDFGKKTFFGVTGDLDGTDIIDIILKQPATAEFIAKKLFEFFVYENPEPALLEALASLLRTHNYEFKPLLRTLLTSEVFYSPRAYRTQIKSPAQLVAGSVRYLGAEVNERALAAAMRMLGQDLLAAPNVKGWDGGEAWISTTTLLARYNLAGWLLGGASRRLSQFEKPKHALDRLYGPDIAADAHRLVDALTARLLQTRLDTQARRWLIGQAETTPVSQRPARIAHLLMSMPDYQLC